MEYLEVVKEYLRNKPGYLKCGNVKVLEYISLYYPESNFSLELIKKAKSEVKKEFRNTSSLMNKKEKKKLSKPEVTDELRIKLIELAKEMGLEKMVVPLSEESKADSFLRRKKALRTFNVPDLKDQEGIHILLGCNHVPFHHKQLHRGIIEMIHDNKSQIRGFHLMGDFLDLNPLSSHDRGKFTCVPGLTLNDEYQIGNDLLYDFDHALPKGCWKTYMYGNHEDRYNRWMSSMDNAKTPLISPEDGLRLWKRGYNVKTSWTQDYITIGNDFDIFHGIYFGIHNAKAHLDKLRRNCAYVHTHRIQNYREGRMSAYNIGSCADFKSPAFNYATRPMKEQWANGFAVNIVDNQGRSNVSQIYVQPDGHFWFGNRYY